MIRIIKMYLRCVGLRGLIKAIQAKITNSSIAFCTSRKDCKHPFYVRVPSSDINTYKQVFTRQEYDFIVKSQPKAIIDAGANIGLASIYFANKYPNAKIIAIEPEQSNFELLKKNVAPYSNVIPIQAALWHQNEIINLIDPGLGKWGFMTEKSKSPNSLTAKHCHAVNAITIEKVMHDNQLTTVDILKIDIEGAEKEVFRDTSSWINNVNALIVELHERKKVGCNRSFYCGSNGFSTEWMQGENVYLSRNNYLAEAVQNSVVAKN